MHESFFLSLFVGAISGAFLAFLFAIVIIPRYGKAFLMHAIQKIPLEAILNGILSKESSKQEIELLLDKRLDQLIQTLKLQIPMGGMFLTGALAEKMKALAKEEILKMLPEVSGMIAGKIKKQNDLPQLIFDKLELYSGAHVKLLLIISISGALFGFLLTLIHNVIFRSF